MKFRTVFLAVAVHLDDKPFGKRVRDRSAHAVQSAGIGVLSAVEFGACVQLGKHDFDAAYAQFRVLVHGYAPAVVGHLHYVVVQKSHGDGVAVTVGDFVNAVVDDFPENVVQPLDARRADIHTRTLPYGVQPFEHAYVPCLVFVTCHIHPNGPPRVNLPQSSVFKVRLLGINSDALRAGAPRARLSIYAKIIPQHLAQ